MKKRIGIIGGGQLGKMLTEAAHKLGFTVIILDPTPNSPAGQVADKQIVGSFKDKNKILELAKISDFITFEIEGVNVEALEKLVAHGISVHPSPKVLKIIKDKFEQKVFLRKHNIPIANFSLIKDKEDCEKQGEIFGYPYLLKARFDAYDGRGNFLVNKKSEISEALKKLSGSSLYAEKFVPFKKELAIISARDTFNNIESFEVVETVHKNNICHVVRSPAPVSNQIKLKAQNLAKQVLEALEGIGVFAVEMFLTRDGKILVNEIAPRVHNSGHHTIEAYTASQFEQHIRAITGLPLAKPIARAKASVMVNILGNRNSKAQYQGEEKAKLIRDVNIHIYGKIETKKERKMGHITALGKTIKDAEKRALKAHGYISI